MMSRKRTHAS